MAAGADSRVQAARQDGRPHRHDRAELTLQVLGRPRARLGLHGRRGARGDGPTGSWTTLPEAEAANTSTRHGRELPDGPGDSNWRPAPVPRPLPESADAAADGHDRRVERVHRQLRRLDRTGPSTCRRTPARRSRSRSRRDHRLGHAGLGRLGRRREGVTDGATVARVQRLRDRRGRLEGRPAAGGHRQPGQRLGAHAPSSSTRAASSPPTTPSTPGSASRASARAAKRNEFMRGVLRQLGVHPRHVAH